MTKTNRVLIGLPDRYDKAKLAIKLFETREQAIQLALAGRRYNGDKKTLDIIEELLKVSDD
jgi:hypothetical protein